MECVLSSFWGGSVSVQAAASAEVTSGVGVSMKIAGGKGVQVDPLCAGSDRMANGGWCVGREFRCMIAGGAGGVFPIFEVVVEVFVLATGELYVEKAGVECFCGGGDYGSGSDVVIGGLFEGAGFRCFRVELDNWREGKRHFEHVALVRETVSEGGAEGCWGG